MNESSWMECFFFLCVHFRLFVNKCGYCLFIRAVVDSFYFSFMFSSKLVFTIFSKLKSKRTENHREQSSGIKVMKAFKYILQHRMFYCSVHMIFSCVFRMLSRVKQLNDRLLKPPLRSKWNSNNNWPLL